MKILFVIAILLSFAYGNAQKENVRDLNNQISNDIKKNRFSIKLNPFNPFNPGPVCEIEIERRLTDRISLSLSMSNYFIHALIGTETQRYGPTRYEYIGLGIKKFNFIPSIIKPIYELDLSMLF